MARQGGEYEDCGVNYREGNSGCNDVRQYAGEDRGDNPIDWNRETANRGLEPAKEAVRRGGSRNPCPP